MSMNASAPSFVPTTAASGGASSSTNDNTTPSRNKSSNSKQQNGKKRPNKKRTTTSSNANRDYNRVVSDLDDLNLVQVAQRTGGSTDKKGRVSLNHLLSFSFPERQEAPATSHRKPKVTSYQPFNKERFINANFRFMLNPTGNYIYQLADPDINFDWDTIEQVLISSAEAQSCPICLSPPTAARVTKCGHIYCLPCILHYLELRESKKNWRKCPICWDSIYEADLKPVRIMKPYAVSDHASNASSTATTTTTTTTTTTVTTLSCGVTDGDRVDMSLMQRSNDSTLAFPLSDTWPLPPNVTSNYMKPDAPLIPWHFTPGAMTFARFMLASPDYLRGEYNRDCVELNDAMSDAQGWGSAEEMPFIEKSLDQILAKMKQLKQQETKELALAIQTSDMMFEAVAKYAKKHGKTPSTHQPPAQTADPAEKAEQVPEAYRQYQLAHQAGEDIETTDRQATSTSNVAPHHRHHNNNSNSNNSNTPATDFFFYQAVDGQHVYLHPLDIRILKHEFGEYDQFPRQLQVQATSVQESTLTEDLRKKCKYLGHLPLACDVTFMEINVREIVSPETIQVYNQELVARVKKRKDKERKEDQRRKQAESKQKLMVVKEQEAERQMLENDPFFSMYRPAMTAEESEEQLSQALSESAASSAPEEEPVVPSAHAGGGQRTVWGTRQVMSREEELMMNQTHDWADHIVINKSHRKRRGRKH
ncbi:hypothetical protein MBANPS3_006716 [Mucor bainieri]